MYRIKGDPLQYHAHYVIIAKQYDAVVFPLDIISYGRLGVTVKKTAVLATVQTSSTSDTNSNQTPNKILYFSIDWQGVT